MNIRRNEGQLVMFRGGPCELFARARNRELTEKLLTFHPMPGVGPEYSPGLCINYSTSYPRDQQRHHAQASLSVIKRLTGVDQHQALACLKSPAPARGPRDESPHAAALMDLDVHPLPLRKRFQTVYPPTTRPLRAYRPTPKLKCSCSSCVARFHQRSPFIREMGRMQSSGVKLANTPARDHLPPALIPNTENDRG